MGREDPSPSAALSTLAGSLWPQEEDPRPPVGLCGAWREWSSSVCNCSGAPLLTLSLERGRFAGAWPVPGLLVTPPQV